MSPRASRRAALEAICRTILPAAFESDGEAGSAPADPVSPESQPRPHLPTLVEQRIQSLPPRLAAGARLALRLTTSRAVVFALSGVPVRFERLGEARRADVLRRMESSPAPALRTAFQAVRRVVLTSWYAEPAAQAEVGALRPLHQREAVLPWEGERGERDEAAAVRAPARGLSVAARGLEPGRRLTADVVVVGSGAGGAVTAAILAEAGRDVLVLEAGRAWPAEERTGLERDMVPRLYADAGARATDDQSIQLLQGQALGGSTFVNWMIMLRAPDDVLHEWSTRHGMEGVDPQSMSAVYDEVEREVGAMQVGPDAHSRNNRILLEGAARLGLAASAGTINARGCVRSGLCGLGCPWSAKQSVDETYLPRAVRAGARVATGARVRRIERLGPESGRLGGTKRVLVDVSGPSGRPSGQATIETPLVVIAGGAVETPALLQRSGMGGGGVGNWLRLHPTTAIAALHDDPVHAETGIPMSVVCRPATTDPSGAGYWLECPPLHAGLAAVAMPGFGERHRRVMLQYARTATTIVLVRDGVGTTRSQGSVRVDAQGRPRIRYRVDSRERAALAEGTTMAARLQLAAGAREVITLHTRGEPIRSESDLVRIAAWPSGPNQLCVFSAHVMGTCRIGPDPASSACRPDGQRHGVRGVYVIDGSLLPTAPGVNPQETIMALATVLATRMT